MFKIVFLYLVPAINFFYYTEGQHFRYLRNVDLLNQESAECKTMEVPSRSVLCFALFQRDDFSKKSMVFDDKFLNSWCCLIEGLDTLQVIQNGSASIYYSINVTIEYNDNQTRAAQPVLPESCDFGLSGSHCWSCDENGEWIGYYDNIPSDMFYLKLSFSGYSCFQFAGKSLYCVILQGTLMVKLYCRLF